MVIYVVKADFWPVFPAKLNPANDRVARGSGLWLFLSWIDGESLPNVAPYQLGYTRIFNCHDYTTVRAKIKVFLVCSHLCGQNRFPARFVNVVKSRKSTCSKGLCGLSGTVADEVQLAPKPSALPTALSQKIGQGGTLPCPFILPNHSAKSRFFSARHTFVPAKAMANTNQKIHITRG